MRGLIDRITNRDVVEELRNTIQEKEETLQELEEKAELLTNSVRVLKMRFDTIFPSTTIEREIDERGSK